MAGLGMISPEWAALRKQTKSVPGEASTIGGAPSTPSDDQVGDLRARQQHHLRQMDQPFRSGWGSVYGATQSIVNGALAGQYGLKLDEATAAQKRETDGKKAAEDSAWDEYFGGAATTGGDAPVAPPGMAGKPVQGPTPSGTPLGMAMPQDERSRLTRLAQGAPGARDFAAKRLMALEDEERKRKSPEYAMEMEIKRAELEKAKRGPERKYQEVNGRIVALDPYGGPATEVYASPTAGQEKPPAGFERDPGNPSRLRPIPGGPGEFKSFTETQTKDANLGARMLRAEDNLDKVLKFDPETLKFEKTDPKTGEVIKGYDPTAGSNAWFPDSGYMGLANAFNSKEWKQYIQAARESMAALLRKDTGAAVTDTEFDLYFPMYYPQPNDDPETVKQKMEARQEISRGLAVGSGGAFDLAYPDRAKQIKGQPKQGSKKFSATNPQTGEIVVSDDGVNWEPQ